MIPALLLCFSLGAFASEHKTSAEVDSLDAKGIALLAKGSIKEALKTFDRAIALDPKDARAYANRCTARYQLKDYAGAVSDYDAAVRLAPKLKHSLLKLSISDAHFRLGHALFMEGKVDKAVEEFYAAVRLDRKNAAAYAGIAEAALKRKDYENAVSYFDRAILLEPGQSSFFAGRSQANAALGRLEQAAKDSRRALQLSGNR